VLDYSKVFEIINEFVYHFKRDNRTIWNFAYGLCDCIINDLNYNYDYIGNMYYVRGFLFAKLFRSDLDLIGFIPNQIKNKDDITIMVRILNVIIKLINISNNYKIIIETNGLKQKIKALASDIIEIAQSRDKSSRIIACILWAALELYILPYLKEYDLKNILDYRKIIEMLAKSSDDIERTAGIISVTASAKSSNINVKLNYFSDHDHNIRRGAAVAMPFLSHPLDQVIDSENFRISQYGEIIMGVHISALFKELFCEILTGKFNINRRHNISVKTWNGLTHNHPEARLAAAISYIGLSNSLNNANERLKQLYKHESWNVRMGLAYGTIILMLRNKFISIIPKIYSILEELLSDSYREVSRAAALALSFHSSNQDMDNNRFKLLIKMYNSNDDFIKMCGLITICNHYCKYKSRLKSKIPNWKLNWNKSGFQDSIINNFFIIVFIDILYQWMDLGAFFLFIFFGLIIANKNK